MIKYTEYDLEAAKKLDDFLPDKIFDAHMHISMYPFCGMKQFGFTDYKKDMFPLFSNRYLRCVALATPTNELKSPEGHLNTINFFSEQLGANPDCVGSLLVKPEESYEEILSHIANPKIVGLKCYHTYAKRESTSDADVHEYLSDTALEIADKYKMTVTIHLVKDRALSDPANMREIKEIAQRYPNAKIVLAHAARSFASWTAIESVSELIPYENVFFDFSAICESPAIIRILKKIGISRCMWGSDYNVSTLLGKAISLGEGFYWIDEEDIERIKQKSIIRPRHIIVENLMAIREAGIICDLSASDVENLFYNNACKVFSKTTAQN